jgi:uncharacterized integral membrane protein (TIGR00697 family)
MITGLFFSIRMGKETLLAFFGLQAIMGNLFVTKQILCFGFHITCSDVYTIGALFCLNILQEYYGKSLGKKGVWITFFLMGFFMMISQIHLLYEPSPYDTTQEAFQTILGTAPRIMLASLITSLISQRCDLFIYGFFKKRFPSQSLIFRFSGAALISQFLDTVLFSFLALYGLIYSMTHIILISYLVKVGIIFCMAPFTTFAKRFIRGPLHI